MGDEDTAVQRLTSGIGAAIFVSWLTFPGTCGPRGVAGRGLCYGRSEPGFGHHRRTAAGYSRCTDGGVDSGCLLRSSQGKEGAIDGTEYGVCAGNSQCRLNLRSVGETDRDPLGISGRQERESKAALLFYYL